MRAYSLRQMQDLGICVDDYKTNENDVFLLQGSTLDYNLWGKNRNVLGFFTFENGNKVMAFAWQNTGYLGIPEIEEGATLMLTFEKAKNGIAYLRKVERYEADKVCLTP